MAAAAMAAPGLATAQLAPGVHVDPGSPAGKEYAIPLSEARAGIASGLVVLRGRVNIGGNGDLVAVRAEHEHRRVGLRLRLSR